MVVLPGNVYRNCTDHGWTDPFSPLEETCDYSFNDTLHFFEEVGVLLPYIQSVSSKSTLSEGE